MACPCLSGECTTPPRKQLLLASFLVLRVLAKLLVVLAQLQPLGSPSFLWRAVIAVTGLRAFQPDVFAHSRGSPSKRRTARLAESRTVKPAFENYLMILVTTPEPTVRPPSRIAKRLPWSMAIDFCNSTSSLTLSPGMHISAPLSSLTPPVTSVVRK